MIEQYPPPTKPWWRSKTIWFNAAAGGVAFIAGAWSAYADALPLPKWAVLVLGGVVAAVNVGLRFVTTDPVTLKRMDDSDGFKDQ